MTLRAAWLFSPRKDLGILGIPLALTLGAYLLARTHDPNIVTERLYAGWMSQFVLGNSTHVILTFFLLATRREVLHATANQARIVIGGSIATLLAAFSFFWLTNRTFPALLDFATAASFTVAMHHTLAQVKGLWSLYNLRSGIRPTDRERSFQTYYVALGLLVIMIKWLCVPKASGRLYPFLMPIPGEPALLPYWTTYVLLGAWLLYGAGLLQSVIARGEASGPKIVYLTTHLFIVALTVMAPGWGAIVSSGVHGLEYYVLCGRMIDATPQERAGERATRLRGALVWPAMLGVMAPLFTIGLLNAPFTGKILGDVASHRYGAAFSIAQMALNSIVITHYFADAFIYRFRIPEIRRVALSRLGFA